MNSLKWIAMALSIVLVAPTAWAHGPHGEEPLATTVMKRLHHALRLELTEEQRTAFHEEFMAVRDEIKPILQELHEGRRTMHEIVTAEEFDAEGAAALAESQGGLTAELSLIAAETAHTVFSRLSDTQRAELDVLRAEHHAGMSRRHERMKRGLREHDKADEAH